MILDHEANDDSSLEAGVLLFHQINEETVPEVTQGVNEAHSQIYLKLLHC